MHNIDRSIKVGVILPVHDLATSIILIVIASLCFSNSYNGHFVFDDSEAIVNNPDIRETPLQLVFQNDFWGTKLSHNQSHKSYRPFTILSFRLQYWFTGKLNPMDFHIVNIILHVIVSVLTLFVFEIFFAWKEPEISLCATILFAVHPVHTEAVSGIVGRADLLCGLFMWLSILSYYNCIHAKSFFMQYNCMLLCIINSVIATFCKETGITVLGICIAYDVISINKILPYRLLQIIKLKFCYKDVKHFLLSKSSLLIRSTILLLSGTLLLYIRLQIMGFSKPKFKPSDNPTSFENNVFFRIINYNYIYSINLWLLLCPDWLCFDWSMGCIPLIKGIDIRISFVIIFWLLCGLFVVTIFSEKDHECIRLITISLALLVFPFLPASNIFFTVGFVLAERTLYVSSAGYCLLLSIGLKKFQAHTTYPVVISVLYCYLIILFSARSWLRSGQWKSETTLFQSGLHVCPLNAKIHYNVGKNAADRGMINYAKLEYEEAIRLNPNYSQAMNNLANLYKDENNYKRAEKLLRKAIELQNDFAAAWMNLGIVLSITHRFKEAEESYIMATSLRSFYPDCYYNLGLLYLARQQYKKALKAWETATKQKLSHLKAWTNMILLHDKLNNKDEALRIAEKALLYMPREPSIHFNIGNILGKTGNFKAAEYHFNEAILRDSENSVYYTNLGVLYHRWKKFDKAEAMYKKALKINPNSSSAEDNLKQLKRLYKTK